MKEWIAEVEKARKGDRKAFDRLVKRFQDYAVALAYARLNDFGEAEDAAQEAFLAAFQELPSLVEPAAFPVWLKRIVLKFCDRRTRRKTLPTLSLEAAEWIACPASRPDLLLEAKERNARVYRAVESLPEGERTVIALFYLGGYSGAEIGGLLTLSVDAVKKRLQRGKARLQERMLTMLQETLRENAPSRDARFAEYNALLLQLTEGLKQDPNVEAAYLAHYDGYRMDGFGTHDDVWSSLTLHLVYTDEKMDALAAGREEFIARFGKPLLTVEAPQNAPDNGYYLMAIYDGEAGPYEVDWYWRPRAEADLPSETLLLFDRIGLVQSEKPLPWRYLEKFPPALVQALEARSEEQKRADETKNKVSLFWAMWMIAAKNAARNAQEPTLAFEGFLLSLKREAAETIGITETDTETAAPNFALKLARLREIGARMETLMPKFIAAGLPVPNAVIAPAYRFLALIERTQG